MFSKECAGDMWDGVRGAVLERYVRGSPDVVPSGIPRLAQECENAGAPQEQYEGDLFMRHCSTGRNGECIVS